MLLPQSAAFAALKNRLNSVSAIGYLHIAPRSYVPSPSSSISQTRNSSVADVASPFLTYRNSIPDNSHTPRNSTTASASSSTYDRPNRLKGRDEGIRWGELLDKFRSVQERARRAQRSSMDLDEGFTFPSDRNEMAQESKAYNNLVRLSGPPVPVKDSPTTASTTSLPKTSKIGLSKLSRLAGSSRLKK